MIQIFSFLIVSIAWAGFAPPSINKNNAGVEKYKLEDYTGAVQDFAGALGKNAFKPEFRFNLAEAFAKNGEHDKALAEFDAVAKDPQAPAELRYKALFNAGNVAVEKKDIPAALNFYQNALDIRPDSVETKTNIELALAQGGGGGEGDDKNQKSQGKGDKKADPKEDDKDGQPQDEKDQQQKNQKPKNKPRPFRSQALSESEVRQILEELKRQEERIRTEHDNKNKKPGQDRNLDKDW